MTRIFAIDIKNGEVVKSFAGARSNYRPLTIKKKDFSDAEKIIELVSHKLGINNFYLADLDSIQKDSNNWCLIKRLVNKYKDNNFYIDSGFNRKSKLEKFKRYINNKCIPENLNIVVGTENIKNKKTLQHICQNTKSFISLDFYKTKPEWFFSGNMTNEGYILMFINRVGGRGVDWKSLTKIRKYLPPYKCLVAGGIKYNGDILKINRMGYAGTIISTIIHSELI